MYGAVDVDVADHLVTLIQVSARLCRNVAIAFGWRIVSSTKTSTTEAREICHRYAILHGLHSGDKLSMGEDGIMRYLAAALCTASLLSWPLNR